MLKIAGAFSNKHQSKDYANYTYKIECLNSVQSFGINWKCLNEIPISYIYDDTSIIVKSLPTSEQSIRVDNITGGNTPDFVFVGIWASV